MPSASGEGVARVRYDENRLGLLCLLKAAQVGEVGIGGADRSP
jgi:hypothetical protein